MKKIINKISRVIQIVLAAPVKWPSKALNVLKYVAIGIGLVETILDDQEIDKGKEEGGARESQ